MQRIALWFARSPLASAAKIFGAVILTLAVAEWTATGQISFDKWQTWVIAALASAVPIIANALNPADTRYGKTMQPEHADDPADGHYPGEPS